MIKPMSNAMLAYSLKPDPTKTEKNMAFLETKGITASAQKIDGPVTEIKKPPIVGFSPKTPIKVASNATVANEWAEPAVPKVGYNTTPVQPEIPICYGPKDPLTPNPDAQAIPAEPEIPICYAPRKTWAAAWREGWAALVDASKKMQSLAKQASDPALSDTDRAMFASEFKKIMSEVIAFGQGLKNEVRSQLDAGQARFYDVAFNANNFRIGNGDISTVEGATEVAKHMEVTSARFSSYNTLMLSIHNSHINAGHTNWL